MAESRNYLYRKAFALFKDAGLLHREDRLSLARGILYDPQLASLRDLSDEDMERLCWALESWRYIQELRHHNGILHTEATILMEQTPEEGRWTIMPM